jgi:hypothetical protein
MNFGKLRSLGNQKKREERMYLCAPSFEDTSVFMGHRYAVQVLKGVFFFLSSAN